MHAPRTTSVSSIAVVIAFACGAAAATASIAILSSPAQAVTPQQGQQYGGQPQHGGQQQYRVVAIDGRNAQQLQQLLTAESAGGWRLAQLSGSMLILQR